MKLRLLIIFSLFTFAVNAQEDNNLFVNDSVYSSTKELDVKPEYPGWLDSFYNAILKNLTFPKMNGKMNTKIFLSFIVEKDGSLSSFKVIRDPGHGLGPAALKAIKSVK